MSRHLCNAEAELCRVFANLPAFHEGDTTNYMLKNVNINTNTNTKWVYDKYELSGDPQVSYIRPVEQNKQNKQNITSLLVQFSPVCAGLSRTSLEIPLSRCNTPCPCYYRHPRVAMDVKPDFVRGFILLKSSGGWEKQRTFVGIYSGR